jgi:hypothetical protein
VAEKGKAARPYICLLISLVLVLTPSVRPLWCDIVSGRDGLDV